MFLPTLLIGESPYRAATDDAQVGRHQIRVIGLVLADKVPRTQAFWLARVVQRAITVSPKGTSWPRYSAPRVA